MKVSLVIFKDDCSRLDFPINKSRIVIGRANACDLRIPLSSVSREHCEVTVEGDSVQMRDLDSSKGTFVHNDRVTEAKLKVGDEIITGPVVFRLVNKDDPKKIDSMLPIVDGQSRGVLNESQLAT